jgi:hypothetical protein
MATIGTTPRPAYIYDAETDTWIPVGVGPHTHANFVESTVIDSKGDLIAGSAPDTVARLGVGTNDTVLTADSTAATGMKWATVANNTFIVNYLDGGESIPNTDIIYISGLSNATSWTYTIDAGASVVSY